MADQPVSFDVGKLTLEPLNHGIAAAARKALDMGIPAHAVIEMHLNHLASIVAMIEPPGVRAGTIEDIVKQFAGLVRQHVDARLTLVPGIVHPSAGVR